MINQVLVYTFGNESHESAITAAARFAARHDAELIGLFVKPDLIGYSGVYGCYPLDLTQTYFDLQKDFSIQAKKQFDSIVSAHNVRSQWHETAEFENKPKLEFYADIIFVSQPDKQSSVISSDTSFINHLITDTGLPTVVIPKGWSAEYFAQHPVLAWKETREAVAAVRHALPIMRNADDVDIVTVSDAKDGDQDHIDGVEISNYLHMHKVKTKYFTEREIEQDHNEADTLLRHVDKHARDLIIMGGYGHSRFREIVLGGVTRALIKKSPVPILLAH
jgi:nucleotide-binding universal stress UspA family protein